VSTHVPLAKSFLRLLSHHTHRVCCGLAWTAGSIRHSNFIHDQASFVKQLESTNEGYLRHSKLGSQVVVALPGGDGAPSGMIPQETASFVVEPTSCLC